MSDNSSVDIPRPHWYSMGLPRAIQITVWISIITVFVISLLDLTGWAFHITFLKSIMPQWIPMKIVTALSFILAATGLVFIQLNLPAILRKILPRILAFFIGLVSLITLYVHIYVILTGHEPSLTSVTYLGFFLPNAARMAFLTACNFSLIGCVLFLLSVNKTKASGIAHAMIIPVTIISYYVLVSYTLGVYSATEVNEIQVALNTAIGFSGICVAVLLLRPDTWLLKIFLSHDTAGIISRRILPPLMVLPIIIGWARIRGERIGLFESEEGVILVAITYTVCFLILIWLTARSVDKIDKKRRSSEEALKESEEKFKLIATNTPDHILVQDRDLRYSFVLNPQLGLTRAYLNS